MQNLFCLASTLSTALTTSIALLAETTISIEYSVAQTSNINAPICYMQTEKGVILDLSNVCGIATKNTTAKSVNTSQLLKTKRCPNCNLSGAKLSSYNLVGADLSGADLSNADLRNTNMFGANLNNANISNAKLSGATMPDGTIYK